MPSEYCKYCGSASVVDVKYQSKTAPTAIGVEAEIGGFGGGVKIDPQSSEFVYYDTKYCTTCKKIDCFCVKRPGEISVRIGTEFFQFYLPKQFLDMIVSFNISEEQLSKFIGKLTKLLVRNDLPIFRRTGRNPCEENEIGFKKTVKLARNPIELHVILENGNHYMDNEGNAITIISKLVYDGGKSQCH